MTIELTNDEAQTLLNGLGELPAKASFNLIIKINTAMIEDQKKSQEQE